MRSYVDDPVAFSMSPPVNDAVIELVIDMTGYPWPRNNVFSNVQSEISDRYASLGRQLEAEYTNLDRDLEELEARRLQEQPEGNLEGGRGMVVMDYAILVPVQSINDTIKNIHRYGYEQASQLLSAKLRAEGHISLSNGILITSITAEKQKSSSTTTEDPTTYCPEERLCFSQTCGYCDTMREDGLACQEFTTDKVGECICACFELEPNRSTTGIVGVTNAASSSSLHMSIVLAALAAAWMQVTGTCGWRLADIPGYNCVPL
jgi:hypothetical protein